MSGRREPSHLVAQYPATCAICSRPFLGKTRATTVCPEDRCQRKAESQRRAARSARKKEREREPVSESE
jgi:hypothetical protein